MRLAVRRLISRGECLPIESRGSREDIKNGWETPELTKEDKIQHENDVMNNDVAAISVGIVEGRLWVDLDYILDSNADVDMNVVMTSDGEFVEVQGTGEEATYTRDQLNQLLDSATKSIQELHDIQKEVLSLVY
jgi:ribonuclease PH